MLQLEAQHRRRLATFSRLREIAAAKGDQKRLDQLTELGKKLNDVYEKKMAQLRKRYSEADWRKARENVALVKAGEVRDTRDRRERRAGAGNDLDEARRRRAEEARRRRAGEGALGGSAGGTGVTDEDRRRRAEDYRKKREEDLQKARDERRRRSGEGVEPPSRDVDRKDRQRRPVEREVDRPGRDTAPDRKTGDRPTRERPKRDPKDPPKKTPEREKPGRGS